MSGCLIRAFRVFPRAPLQPVRRGRDSAVWYVPARARVYMAKIYPAGRLEHVQREADLLDYLSRVGMAVPRFERTRAGEAAGVLSALVWPRLRPARFPVALSRVEEGRRVYAGAVTREELAAVARRIGAMHRALLDYPGRAQVRRLERAGAHLGGFADLRQSPYAARFKPAQLARWEALDAQLERARRRISGAPLTESVLHGDLGLEHVRFVPASEVTEQAVQFFDFSDFAAGPVVFDLAVMLSRLYWECDIGFGRWERLRLWLLEGYNAASALTRQDERALEPALLERLLIEVRYLTRVSLQTRAPYQPEGVRKRYALAEHVLERRAARTRSAARIATRAGGDAARFGHT